ncbi:hypothetical protein JB92DRAFT_2133227 [Gautieria morchelliformis]|nr:hypothetical protein JB92DRAFT_2133227 [Gautieria morchelliformis]
MRAAAWLMSSCAWRLSETLGRPLHSEGIPCMVDLENLRELALLLDRVVSAEVSPHDRDVGDGHQPVAPGPLLGYVVRTRMCGEVLDELREEEEERGRAVYVGVCVCAGNCASDIIGNGDGVQETAGNGATQPLGRCAGRAVRSDARTSGCAQCASGCGPYLRACRERQASMTDLTYITRASKEESCVRRVSTSCPMLFWTPNAKASFCLASCTTRIADTGAVRDRWRSVKRFSGGAASTATHGVEPSGRCQHAAQELQEWRRTYEEAECVQRVR